MSAYEKELEEQNEHLQEKLGKLEKFVDNMPNNIFILELAWLAGTEEELIPGRGKSVSFEHYGMALSIRDFKLLRRREIGKPKEPVHPNWIGYRVFIPGCVYNGKMNGIMPLEYFYFNREFYFIYGWTYDSMVKNIVELKNYKTVPHHVPNFKKLEEMGVIESADSYLQ